MSKVKSLIIALALVICWYPVIADEPATTEQQSRISGIFELDVQSYQPDNIIGAKTPDEKVLSNGFLYLNYTSGNFNAGMRYESYLNPILQFEDYKGSGIAYRFAEFNSDFISVTAGNFYEQFGSGMIFRAYEERALGYDNAMDGLRVKLRPTAGIDLTGMIGRQRLFWGLGEGIVRGADMNINVNTVFESLLPQYLQISAGGSLVSKFQPDQNSTYNLPKNVTAYSGRLNVNGPSFSLETEYAYKNPDPSTANKFNYNPGKALMLSASYFESGIGLSLNFHQTDNMDFRSDRYEAGKNLLMNFLPPLTKLHIYRLPTLFPYATQLNGEIGWQAELTYTFAENSFLGGEYGTTVNINASQVNSINKTPTYTDSVDVKDNRHVFEYTSKLFEFGKKTYFRDFNIEVSHKWNDRFKSNISAITILYDRDLMENNGSGKYGIVKGTILVADLTFKITDDQSIRTEFQHLWSKRDQDTVIDNTNGNWAMALAEYTIAPSWYFSVFDEYNYGNGSKDLQLHYLNANVAYVLGTSRVSLGYGRQRGGLLCVGGVCRQVLPSNGLLLTLSSSF